MIFGSHFKKGGQTLKAREIVTLPQLFNAMVQLREGFKEKIT